jgi:5,10-methylenetetrahydromethanopterin reductase
MRIGIFIGVVGSAPTLEGQVQQVVEVEADSFDSYWTPQVAGTDALTLLALAGARTSRIEVGTAVLPIFQRHPTALAQQALTTQAATSGRLALGIGLSHKPSVEDRMGLSFDKPALRMLEYLTVLRELVQKGQTRFSGKTLSVSATVQVPSGSPFPILIAALGPRMLKIAGELSEGTVTWMVGPKTLRGHITPRITAAASASGRPAPRICAGVPICVTDDPAGARGRAAELFQHYGSLPSYRKMLEMEGTTEPAYVAVVGDEASVERQLREYSEGGATDLLAVVFPGGPDEDVSNARTRALLKKLVGKL